MKDKIQILLSMVVCLFMTFSMNAQTYDFTVTSGDIDGEVLTGTSANGANCAGGFAEMSIDVTGTATTCPSGDVLDTNIGGGLILDNVTVNITHTFDGDMDILLVSPAGTFHELTSGTGGSDDNFTGTIFTDAAADNITAGAGPFTGEFVPQGGPMNPAFDGEAAEGTWTVQVCDTFNDAGADVDGDGDLDSGSITFALNELACPIVCTLTCPADQVINLEAGECEELVLFDPAVLGGDDLCMVAETFDIMNFQDGFGPDDATTNASGDGAFVDVSGAPASIITSGGTTTGMSCYNMTAPAAGAFSVDWNYETPDGSFWDPVSITVDGARTEVTANNFGGGTESGTFNANVNEGSVINLCQEHDASVGPSVSTWSNLSLIVAPGYVIEQCGGPESGTYQGAGVYVIEYCATNNQDLTDVITCSTTITVNEYSGPVLSSLTCNDGLNISVDDACEVEFGADMFLEGGPYSCYDDYIVTIRPFGNANLDFVPNGPVDFSTALGTHEYVITAADGNSCWGEFTVEDKLGPTIECRDLAVNCIEPIPFGSAPGGISTSNYVLVANVMPAEDMVTEYSIEITDAGSILDLNVVADFGYDNTNASGLRMTITSPQGVDYLLWDFLNGCGGFFDYVGDDAGINQNACAPLQDGGNFDIASFLAGFGFASTPFSMANGTSPEGTWTLTVEETNGFAGEAGPLTINNITLQITQEFAEVLPSDNCGAVSISTSDVVTQGSCDTGIDRIIERTYLVTDQNGMSSECSQTITVATIGVNDITPPVTPIELPCGTGTSPEEITAFFDNPLTNDIQLSANCQIVTIEKNEGIPFGYFNYPETGCDGNVYPQPVDNNVCNLYATYSDQEIPACAPGCNGNIKVIRTWTVLDWCSPSAAPLTFIQIIKSVDTVAPTIEANGFDVSVNPWNCLGDFSMPAPTLLHDLCTSDLSYTVSGPAGTTLLAPNTPANQSDFWVVFGAPKTMPGQPNIFTYTASDCCGNTASVDVEVNVYDTTPPVPVATQNIVVNLTTSGQPDENGNAVGIAKIYAASVNNGSYDGCSGVKIEIAREDDACDVRGNDTFNADGHPGDGSPNPNASNYDPDGGEFVKFCCADINQVDEATGVEYGLVPVRMRVFDDGNMTGFYGDFVDNNGDGDVLDAGEYDNFNETWVTVRVEGKAIASIVCPPDVTLACDMDYTDPAMIGTATTLSLCGSESVTTSFTPQLNACGVGFVIATYTVEGSSPAITCSQRITIENPYPAFDPNGIRYPRNLPTSPTGQIACTDDITYDAPTWTAGACDFIGYTEDVDTFFIEAGTGDNDACFKILRSFTVIDWCVYDATNGQDGLYFGSQTIKITDKEAPILLDCEPAMFDVDGDCVRTSTTLTNTAQDNGDCASDWLKWQVFVDTWGDGVVDYEYSSFLPTNDSNINNDTNGNGINDRYLAPTMSDEEVSITVTEVMESSMFNHIVEWKVTDGCGNVASCTTTFMVVDKKAPTPYCVSLSTALMENGGVELWAIDFDLGAFDNCTEQEDLRFTFSSTIPEDDNDYDPTQNSSAMVFTDCGVQSFDVYVWDAAGNADFCTVTLTVDGANCEDVVPEGCPDCSESEFTGMAVATCESKTLGGAVGAIYNVRNNEGRDNGDVWLDVEVIHPTNWTRGDIGQKFGIALDSEDNIYLAGSDVYGLDLSNSGVSRGSIHKCAPPLFEAVPLVDLDNSGGRLNGLGNIVYDRVNDQLFASNLEDGKIYRISTNGLILGEFDPWSSDDGSDGIVAQSEQVWGLGINTYDSNTKIYFARIVEGGERSIYSITLSTNGAFTNASASLEVEEIPGLLPRVTDFAFSDDGSQLIISERGTERADGSHIAKTMSFNVDNGEIDYDFQFYVGGFVPSNDPTMFLNGENSAGGVDFGYSSANGIVNTDCEEEPIVWATGNFMFTQTFEKAYGLEGMSASGNQPWDAANDEGNMNTDIFIDFDGVDGTSPKGLIGDIEIFRCTPSTSNRMAIAGTTATENGNGVRDAEVLTEALLPEYPATSMTTTTGEFAFVENPTHIDYRVTVEKNDNHSNGVSTLDLVLIQRHIIALADLDSPYKVIAADINRDDKVSAQDVVELRKLILGVQDEFTNNTSWRFVDATQTFVDILAPFPVDESRNVNDLSSDMMHEDFVAVKIGDVNATAAHNVAGATTEVRSGTTMLLEVSDKTVVAGEQVEIAVNSADFNAVSGLQMTMEFNGLTFNDVAGKAIAVGAGNVGVISDNVITMSWNSNTAVSTTDELFIITAVATKDGNISEMINITDRVITPEVYTSTSLSTGSGFITSNIELGIRGANGLPLANELMQNEPNPFKQSTAISFNLAKAGKASLTIRDVAGKVIRTVNGEYTAGMNTISIEKSDINTVGVLYYTIESGDFSETKKMIIVE